MKISYSWLKEFVDCDLDAVAAGELLTSCGLEVESVEEVETVKGGLRGMVVGEVLTKEKHPDADKLSLTTVSIGRDEPLKIVCGAPNVAAGQKVVVATVGAKLYPSSGEPFEIKKSKIRGAVSEGMLCAEDEIGLGTSHAGIMVLDERAVPGTPAAEYFSLSSDHVLEIGLTPNRADAASHAGVARDLAAVLAVRDHRASSFRLPDVSGFTEGNEPSPEVNVKDPVACIRYSSLVIAGVKVGESPEWLRNRLLAAGLRPINNIVDVTNYVMLELGQPLHAFDLAAISSGTVEVRTLPAGTRFTTLDGVSRELHADDLMICNGDQPMCIAGVFGGEASGVSESTSSVFLESACFSPVSVRRTARRHGLRTDASFRFERGTDPAITRFALMRAANLITSIAGGKVSSPISDVYPRPVEPFRVPFSFANCEKLAGQAIPQEKIKLILTSLGIEIEHEGQDALLLSVPAFKVDVTREQDVIEEVLRIYGYNNIGIPETLNSSISYAQKPDPSYVRRQVSEFLTAQGLNEIMSLSLSSGSLHERAGFDSSLQVKMLNPLSSDLDVMRQTLLFSGLQAIGYNSNRKSEDLRLYEFGKIYSRSSGGTFQESQQLAIFLSGREQPESWNTPNTENSFYSLKAVVDGLMDRLGLQVRSAEGNSGLFAYSLSYSLNGKLLVSLGQVERQMLKLADVKRPVYYAEFNWDLMLEAIASRKALMYSEVPKFPEVRRDLALLIDKNVNFGQLEQLAFQTEKKLLRDVNLFDVYEGDKLPEGKKSYALSFILRDDQATLTDKEIERIMEKLIKTYREKAGAEIR